MGIITELREDREEEEARLDRLNRELAGVRARGRGSRGWDAALRETEEKLTDEIAVVKVRLERIAEVLPRE